MDKPRFYIITTPTGYLAFDGKGPPNSNHLQSTSKELVEKVCTLMNAADEFNKKECAC